MMKGKAIIPLALGLAVGLVAVKVVVDFVNKAQGSVTQQQTVKVVRAKVDIDGQAEITPEMVEVIETPEGGLLPLTGRFEEPDAVLGRVTGKPIPALSPILENMLAPPGTLPGMVGRIPSGYRAVSVKIDEATSVAYQIKPGDWVDVIVVMEVEARGSRNRRETIAETVLQNVQIAALGRDIQGEQAGATAKNKPAKSATLFVHETDVPKLHLAQTRGKITMAMRGGDDATLGGGGIVRGSDVFEALREPDEPVPATVVQQVQNVPAPPPELIIPHQVVVHRGSTLLGLQPSTESVTFEDKESSQIISVRDGAAAGSETMMKGRRAVSRTRTRSHEAHPRSEETDSEAAPERGE